MGQFFSTVHFIESSFSSSGRFLRLSSCSTGATVWWHSCTFLFVLFLSSVSAGCWKRAFGERFGSMEREWIWSWPADFTTDGAKLCRRNTGDFNEKRSLTSGGNGREGFILASDGLGGGVVDCSFLEKSCTDMSWDKNGCDFAMHCSTHWRNCSGQIRHDWSRKWGRRCKCICGCCSSFGLLDGLVSGKMSLDSSSSVFSCSCGGGDCLSQWQDSRLHWL